MAGQLEKFEMKPSLPGGGEAVDELGNSLDFLKFGNSQFFSWAFFWIQLTNILYYPNYFLRVRITERKKQSPFKWIFILLKASFKYLYGPD